MSTTGRVRLALPARTEMPVIAALERKRQIDIQPAEQVRRPGPKRDHNILGIDRPFIGVDAPISLRAMQRLCIAVEHDAAERSKARRIGFGDCERIGDAGRVRPMDRVTKHRIERRLQAARFIDAQCAVVEADRDSRLALASSRRKGLVSCDRA